MKAVVIGAGRGIRLMPETESYPKCMMDGLGGRRVLDWILDSLASAGIDDIVFIGGYHMEKVVNAYPQLRFYHNDQWSKNNILASLFCAEEELVTPFVVSYSDIVYRRNVTQRLMTKQADIAIVVDRDWRRRYVGRTAHPETQAEKVVVENGWVASIGKHLSASEAYGEFIGLARFDQGAADVLRIRYREIREAYPERPFQQAATFRDAYLTDMLQELIDLGVRIEPIDIWADWAELDTPQDLAWARQQLSIHGKQDLST